MRVSELQGGPEGVPLGDGHHGFVNIEGQRFPCACSGGRLIIDVNAGLQPPQVPFPPHAGLTYSSDPPRPPMCPPPPSPPRTPRAALRAATYGTDTASSRTPGGTPVPPAASASGLSPGGIETIEEPSKLVSKLPVLASMKGTAGGDAAVMAGDWLAQLSPSMASLSTGAAVWWKSLLDSIMSIYSTWLESSPIVRLNIRHQLLAEQPPQDQFQRVEQRAAMLLLECLPEELRSEAVSARATSVKGMLFLTLCSYQPGGAGEKHYLQQFLTTPDVATSLDSGVTLARKWIRLFRRGKELSVVIPDPALLVRGLDRLVSKLFQEGKQHSSSSFRVATFKLERQLDYKPTENGVLAFAQLILGEMEAALLALPPTTSTRVAACNDGPDGEAGAKGKGKSKSKSKAGAKPCWKWTDGSGCRLGLQCSFAHDPLGPGRCWICGSSDHMKPACPVGQAPAGTDSSQGGDQQHGGGSGGGGEENTNPKPKKQPKKKPKKEAIRKAEEEKVEPPPGESSAAATSSMPAASGASLAASSQQEFLQEATKVLKSMRLAKLASDAGGQCLVDGGATTSMRRASSEDEVSGLPRKVVKLAIGETFLCE